MKDFFGRHVIVGGSVAFFDRTKGEFARGKVLRFRRGYVVIEAKGLNETFNVNRSPHNVIVG